MNQLCGEALHEMFLRHPIYMTYLLVNKTIFCDRSTYRYDAETELLDKSVRDNKKEILEANIFQVIFLYVLCTD